VGLTFHKPVWWLAALIFGTALFDRNFSYIHIRVGNIPFYITEIALLSLLVSVALLRLLFGSIHGKLNLSTTPLHSWVLMYLLIGTALFIEGSREYGTLKAARHFALVYYSIFFFIFVELIKSYRSFLLVIKTFFLGSLLFNLTVVIAPMFYITVYPVVVGPPVAATTYAGIVLIFLLFGPRTLIRSWPLKCLMIILYMPYIILTEVRGVWVSFGGALALAYLCAPKRELQIRLKRGISLILTGLALVLIFFLLSGRPLARYWDEFMSIFFVTASDSPLARVSVNNALWRIEMWKEVFRQFQTHTLTGIGFGSVFSLKPEHLPDALRLVLSPVSMTNVDVHNSHLAVLLRMGLAGFIVYIGINYVFCKRCLSFLRTHPDSEAKAYMLAILGAYFLYLIVASFNVALEGPFLGIFFWMLMGMGMTLPQIYHRASECP
jgi:O-antigen ligase